MLEQKGRTREELLAVRDELLAREKELTHRIDELRRQRRALLAASTRTPSTVGSR
ncbi:MAG: DUF899 domain-containing protein [Streptosporangiales bacterium]|nr:DUF899 domain-containing protein [Streptosporangiales bacterium]